MVFSELLPANAGTALVSVAKRLSIAALAVPLLWGSLMYCFQSLVSRWSRHPLTSSVHAERTGVLGIAFSILSSIFVVFLLPTLLTDAALTTNVVLWYHRFGVALLGDFLLAALVFQFKYSFQSKNWNHIHQARAVFTKWLWITETMPGPAAIIILFTGLQRVATVPGYSLNQGWILFLVAILAIMMSDGIFSYTPAVRDLASLSEQGDNIPAFLENSRSRLRDLKLFIHSLSFPIVLLFPTWRIASNLNALKPLFDKLHLDQTEGGWRQLLPAIAVFIALFVFVATLNRWGRHEQKPI